MKYKKVSKGRLLRCWYGCIKEDFTLKDEEWVKCPCGNIIGKTEDKCIRMKQGAFTYSGSITRK